MVSFLPCGRGEREKRWEVRGERREGRSPGPVGGFSFREAVCRIADDFPMTVAGGAYEADDAGVF